MALRTGQASTMLVRTRPAARPRVRQSDRKTTASFITALRAVLGMDPIPCHTNAQETVEQWIGRCTRSAQLRQDGMVRARGSGA
jgi:hypothetical protein